MGSAFTKVFARMFGKASTQLIQHCHRINNSSSSIEPAWRVQLGGTLSLYVAREQQRLLALVDVRLCAVVMSERCFVERL